jgi:hypothetical protein
VFDASLDTKALAEARTKIQKLRRVIFLQNNENREIVSGNKTSLEHCFLSGNPSGQLRRSSLKKVCRVERANPDF